MRSHDDIGAVDCDPERRVAESDLTPLEVRTMVATYRALQSFWTDQCGLPLERARALIDNDVRAHLNLLELTFGKLSPREEMRRIHERLAHLLDGITAKVS